MCRHRFILCEFQVRIIKEESQNICLKRGRGACWGRAPGRSCSTGATAHTPLLDSPSPPREPGGGWGSDLSRESFSVPVGQRGCPALFGQRPLPVRGLARTISGSGDMSGKEQSGAWVAMCAGVQVCTCFRNQGTAAKSSRDFTENGGRGFG